MTIPPTAQPTATPRSSRSRLGRVGIACSLLVLAALPAAARTSEADLRRHIDYLASDALQGRKPGTAGERLAGRYIAGQLAGIGVQPGAPDGSWYQPVALIERTALSAATRWRGSRGMIRVSPEEVVLSGAEPKVELKEAELVFAGYALDIGDEPLTGAVLLVMAGAPTGVVAPPSAETRRRALLARGAAAVLTIAREGEAWTRYRDQLRSGRSMLAGEPVARIEGAIQQGAWRRLARAAGQDASVLEIAAAGAGFRPQRLGMRASISVETRIRTYTGHNVVGRLPGRDPAAGQVVHLAHYDHLGICRPEGAADRICNGAVDNASGVAMLIEVARGLAAAGPAPRDQIFLATTAEEMGLLGARADVQALGESRAKLVAALNYDTVAVAPKGEPISIVGRGRTPALDAAVERAARAVRRKIDRSEAPNAFIARQDGWEFLKAGIPAVMAGGSFTNARRLAGFLSGPYHQPEDDPRAPIELGGAAEDSDFAVALGRELADPARYKGGAATILP